MRIVRYSYPNYRRSLSTGGFTRSPWSGLESEIDHLFETALTQFAGAPTSQSRFPVDLYEDANNTYVRAELPGVNRDEINVEVAEGYLTVSASRKKPADSNNQPEDSFSFSRSVTLPDDVQTDKVAAAYENGILTVTLPKREEAKPKKISVAVK